MSEKKGEVDTKDYRRKNLNKKNISWSGCCTVPDKSYETY